MSKEDLSVLFFNYLGYSRIRNLVFHLLRKPVARFICFHDILPSHADSFRAKLRFLKQRTNVVSLDDFFAGRLSAKKTNVVITFDDGFKGWVLYAVPALREFELPAAFFISSGFVGLSKNEEARFVRSNLFPEPYRSNLFPGLREPPPTSGCLSSEDVIGLAEDFTVGGHTLNHLDPAALIDQDQIRYEISEDKLRLEKLTGRKIGYFSYPFGSHYNSEIDLVELLIKAGYKGAVTTEPGWNYDGANAFLLRRELTRASMPAKIFKARVFGNYDAVRFLKTLVAPKR